MVSFSSLLPVVASLVVAMLTQDATAYDERNPWVWFKEHGTGPYGQDVMVYLNNRTYVSPVNGAVQTSPFNVCMNIHRCFNDKASAIYWDLKKKYTAIYVSFYEDIDCSGIGWSVPVNNTRVETMKSGFNDQISSFMFMEWTMKNGLDQNPRAYADGCASCTTKTYLYPDPTGYPFGSGPNMCPVTTCNGDPTCLPTLPVWYSTQAH